MKRAATDVAPSEWDTLDNQVGGRLIRMDSLSAADDLGNPFAIQEHPGGYQTTGWLDAYVAQPSPYAVAARTAEDIVAAVSFARQHDLEIVIKGTGHDYLGRSSRPGGLLVWTHHMREVVVHDEFVITNGGGRNDQRDAEPVPAITVGAGTRWLEAYQAATPYGRYVQGGGCTSVGAAGGFVQGGGFGSFSKRFGTAAGNVLEIEVVTADGAILVVNRAQHPDLFWALRGGGGGTFGIVSKVAMRTHPMPETVGIALGTITAASDAGYRRLIREFLAFSAGNLNNERWGEQVAFGDDNTLLLSMTFLDLDEAGAGATWRPFLDHLARRPDELAVDLHFPCLPFRALWDLDWLAEHAPELIARDGRPGAPTGQFWWATNQDEVSQYLNAYQSRWLPLAMFAGPDAPALADALFAASREWPCTLHLNKALAGASPEAAARDRTTAVNPAAFDAAALLIMVSNQQQALPGRAGREPDQTAGAAAAAKVAGAMEKIRRATPGAGAYLNEADYFEPDWQHSFWGSNYDRLLEIKRRYDPTNLFTVHHGVGSEL